MKVDYDFFKIDSKLSPQKGRVIISEPFLQGNYFSRSTVLLVDYSANGAVGFILNKPFKAGIKELFVNFPDYNYDVFVGGPVNEDNLYYIHTLGNHIKGSIKVKDDLYWGGDFEQLKSIIDLGGVGANQIKFFLGYSGWSPGQLDSEIAEKSWLVAESDIQMIMNGSKDLWLESVKKAGDRYKTWKNFPKDPKLN